MRAKVMLLSAAEQDEINAAYAEKILVDISAAFGHSFSLMEEKIGEKSRAASGETLTDKAIEACQQCQAVFVCDAQAEGLQELYDALNLPLLIRSFCVPEVLCSRHEAPVCLYVGSVFSLDEATLRKAARTAFQFAQDEDIRLCHAAPTGASRPDWEAALRVQEASRPQVAAAALSAPDAIRAIITAPERMGLLLCPPFAGSMMLAAAGALCAHPSVMHDFSFDASIGVYAPWLPPEGSEPSPISAAYAVAKMLRLSLKLPREAACLEAAIGNVIAAGGQEKEQQDGGSVTGEGVAQLICEQITAAGELMVKGGLS